MRGGVGNLHTNKTWSQSLQDLKAELEKWARQDYILPTYDESKRTGVVTLKVGIKGIWKDISCGRWKSWELKSQERNLRALVMAVESARLADQRGISGLLHDVIQHLALRSGDGDPYQILGVPPDTRDTTVLLIAYRAKVKEHHPDTGGSVEAYERILKAGQALGIVDQNGHTRQ